MIAACTDEDDVAHSSSRMAAPPPGFDTNRLRPSMAALCGSGRKYDSLTDRKNVSTFSVGTIETAQPPQPAPVRRAPTAPDFLQTERGDNILLHILTLLKPGLLFNSVPLEGAANV